MPVVHTAIDPQEPALFCHDSLRSSSFHVSSSHQHNPSSLPSEMSAVDTGTPITPETFEGLPECPVITRKDGVHKNTILKSHGRPPW